VQFPEAKHSKPVSFEKAESTPWKRRRVSDVSFSGWEPAGDETLNAALYARVSTKTGSQNPDMQLRELRDYCQRRRWEITGEYVDAGVTGAKEQRPELDQLLAECRKRRVDAVVVYRYDRFARSLRQLVNALEEFRALGIEFVSLHEGVDTSTPNGRLVFGIFASIAEFERELIRERVRSGLAAARARGKKIGRPRKTVDAAKIAQLRENGVPWRAIAARLGISVGTAYSVAQARSKNVVREDSVSS
jgi:DNA invertase Pin-like site-specific DNA recombinase